MMKRTPCMSPSPNSSSTNIFLLSPALSAKLQLESCDSTSFLSAFNSELDKVTSTISYSSQAIESNAQAVLVEADALSRDVEKLGLGYGESVRGMVVELRRQGKEITEQALRDREQTAAYAQQFLTLAHQADEKFSTSLAATTQLRFTSAPWNNDHSLLPILLSDLYSLIRDLENASNSKDSTWVAPTSFERVTTKYWVKDHDLFSVILSSVTELPLLVYGRKGSKILDLENPESLDTSWTSLASNISSVYFDSPGMKMYSERIKRSEGAQLFRIRWYGPKPRGEEVIFLELKTHHEKWIGDSSVKERCGIREKYVEELLDVSSGKWSAKQAYDMVRDSNPKESEESLLKLAKVLLQIRELVVKKKLTPCVRTKYTRVALQSAFNNKLRLTIDRDITMINERGCRPKSSWCLEDDDVISSEAMVKMPYCVFEVKVAGADGPPSLITDLKGRGAIVEAKKFSKYLSGASIFHANTVKTLPWWASEEEFKPLFGKRVGTADNSSNTEQLSQQQSSNTQGSGSASNCSTYDNTIDNSGRSTFSKKRFSLTRSYISTTLQSSRRRSGLFKKESSDFDKPVASKSPVRVEPKSYFANERTFIQWISAALLFITLSQLLYILGRSTNTPQASSAGFFMSLMSLLIAIYSIGIYYRRIYLMKNGKPYGYADFIGPGVLTASIITGITLMIVFERNNGLTPPAVTMSHQSGTCVKRGMEGVPIMEMQPSGVIVDKERELLLVPSLSRVVALPSGLPSDEENTARVKTIAKIQGANLEALEYASGRLLALSEETDSSEIIYLDWKDEDGDSYQLEEIHRWKIDLIGAEAMAVVPGEGEEAPKLIVAGDMLSSLNAPVATAEKGRLSIDVYDLDSLDVDVDKVKASSKMNKALVAKDLLDEKVGDMQYFEGLLYMLFDNDRVIRAFDTKTGEIVQETKLPVATEGSELEWEGMHLERINTNMFVGGVRGASDGNGDLVLHLTLDTPGQIWSLKVDEVENFSTGPRWHLPKCAI